MFADLNTELENLPDLAIVAVGGLPILSSQGNYTLCGAPIDTDSLRAQLLQGLGLGAVLTYKNPNQKSLIQLGQLCLSKNHLWTAHVLSLTLVFHQAPIALRNAFAFDRQFHLSWVESEVDSTPCTFTATASLRQWYRMINYADQPSFSAPQRQWFTKVQSLLSPILLG